jgi:sulfatase maturation enzyme AslB (radical SAM superfamily)
MKGMHLSRYLKSWTYPEEPGLRLLYSTKNTAVILLPDEAYEKLLRGEVEPEYRETLTDIGMLVADPHREQEEVFSMLEAMNRLDPVVNASVILGMGCNFNCVYCYE